CPYRRAIAPLLSRQFSGSSRSSPCSDSLSISSTSIYLFCRPPPSLHSFPTRRSSDLRVSHDCSNCGCDGNTALPHRALGCSGTRSEEHTSELQSHLNLVCRLLLEKKKNIHGVQRCALASIEIWCVIKQESDTDGNGVD